MARYRNQPVHGEYYENGLQELHYGKRFERPWVNGPDEKCTWTVVTSTASDLEVKGTSCELGKEYGMSTNVDIKLHAVDTENVKASMQGTSTGNGQTVNLSGAFTVKWMSSSGSAN